MSLSPLRLGLVVAVAVASVGACGRDTGPEAAPPPASGSGGDSASVWELVYDVQIGENADLYVISASDAAPRRLTESPGYDGMARYTPDGERIVFSSERTGHWQLFDIPAEGGEARRLRTNGATEYQADPSPDGETLAFLTNLEGPERLVLVPRLGDGPLRELVRHGKKTIFGNPSWSPDGGQITFSSNWRIGHQIYVVDVASGETRRLSPLTSGGCEPRFTRDGGRVCYVSRGHLRSRSRLVAHDLETGEEEVLVDWPGMNYDPAFSPDGTEIAFASDVTGKFEIYRQRLSDGKAWRVTHGPGQARYPDYRPRP